MKPFTSHSSAIPLEQIEQQIQEITTITSERFQELEHIGVLRGISGIALLQFYASQYFDNDQYAEKGVDIISSCISLINNGYSFPNYAMGIAGFGWTLQHLNEKKFIDVDIDEFLVPLDDYLGDHMNLELSNKNYDFLKGASGYALYFLLRYKNSNGSLQKKYRALLENFVQDLKKIAIYEDHFIMWESIINRRKNTKGFNLSLSSGIASIIYILYKIESENIAVDLIHELLRGATSFLLRYEDLSKTNISRFPDWVEPGVKPIFNSRVAWCYGDIGVGKAFYYASESLKSDFLKNKALEILLDTAKRLKPDTIFVNDAGFCNGSFGNAHIFKELAVIHQNPIFSKASEFWIQDGLDKYTGDKGEPFRQFIDGKENQYFEINLLDGISGIGLGLLGYISKEENSWDECFMLS